MDTTKVKVSTVAPCDCSDAARVLLELKNDTPTSPKKQVQEQRCAENISEPQVSEKALLLANIENRGSAWSKLFDNTKYELRIMEQIVRNLLRQFDVTDNFPNIDDTFKHRQCSSSNGYTAILYTVTTVLNQLRFLVQNAFGHHIGTTTTKTKHVELFSKVIHLLNKYENHTWHQQTRNCNNYSPRLEVKKFDALLTNIKQFLEKLVPSQRATIYDIIKTDAACIEKTGLLAKHAFKHITNEIEDCSNITIKYD